MIWWLVLIISNDIVLPYYDNVSFLIHISRTRQSRHSMASITADWEAATLAILEWMLEFYSLHELISLPSFSRLKWICLKKSLKYFLTSIRLLESVLSSYSSEDAWEMLDFIWEKNGREMLVSSSIFSVEANLLNLMPVIGLHIFLCNNENYFSVGP